LDDDNKERVGPLKRLGRLFIGPARDPMQAETRHRMALIAFLAWVGLGADGLSSSNYGPAEAFVALGVHTHLAVYLALATALTVFIISMAYIQVIELFPHGGGGYRVATTLIGPYAGLVSGSALIIDYVLTIAISVASGIDALFSLLPLGFQWWKLPTELVVVFVLLALNLRGAKESLKLLVPLFIGFLATHGFMIVYGIVAHADSIPSLLPQTRVDTANLVQEIGWVAFASFVLRAFALGGGTYTGIEAVSNSVNILREPRVRTGRWTMFYMAASLAFTAGGLILIYLLWGAAPVEGQTLNAVVFTSVLEELVGDGPLATTLLTVTLVFAAGLLFVAANTGYLGGPAVLANMALDRWMPHQFSQLSNRLVTQNGIVLMGAAAAGALLITGGDVSVLVVLYSINVFLTFSLSLSGLCLHHVRNPRQPKAMRKLAMALLGLLVALFILLLTIFEKFLEGGWMTILITGFVIALGLSIRRHYRDVAKQVAQADALFATASTQAVSADAPALDPKAPTAVFLVGASLGTGMHCLLATLKMFPNHFRNFIFIRVGEIDVEALNDEKLIEELRVDVDRDLAHFVNWCHRHKMAAASLHTFAADVVDGLDKLAEEVLADYPNSLFFASQLLFENDNVLIRQLHNQTALEMQRHLHLRGVPMVILPMRV